MDEAERLKMELDDCRDGIIRIAGEALIHWDQDRDAKVGKILRALSGDMPGYRADIDKVLGRNETKGKP